MMRTKIELCEDLRRLVAEIKQFDCGHATQAEMDREFSKWSRTLGQIVMEASQVRGVEAPYIGYNASEARRLLREALKLGSENRETNIWRATGMIGCIRNNIDMLGQQ